MEVQTYNVGLPKDCEIDDSCPFKVGAIAVVSDPANKTAFEYTDRGTVIATALKPDQKIFRHNPITGENYNIQFSKDMIKRLHSQYVSNNTGGAAIITLEHGGKQLDVKPTKSIIDSRGVWSFEYPLTTDLKNAIEAGKVGISIEANAVRNPEEIKLHRQLTKDEQAALLVGMLKDAVFEMRADKLIKAIKNY